MKKLTSLFFSILIALPLLCQQKPNVYIEGQILNYDGKAKIKYMISPVAEGLPNYSVQPDSTGMFVISQYINEPRFFHFGVSMKDSTSHSCKLILEPGKRYKIVSEGMTWQKMEELTPYSPEIYTWETFDGEGRSFYRYNEGLVQYNKIANGYGGTLFNHEWDLNKPNQLLDTMQYRIKKHVMVFDQLLNEGKIDQQLYNISKLNIEYMYASRLLYTIRSTYLFPEFEIKDTLKRNQLYDLYVEIFDMYPVKGVPIENISNYMMYTDLYLEFLADYRSGKFTPVKRKGYGDIYDRSGEFLSEEANKYYQFMLNFCKTASLETHSLKFSQKFLDENPELRETWAGKVLEERLMPRVEEFKYLANESIPEGCIILNGDSINTIEELAQQFKGKPLLIDCWGSWCAPCRYQFGFMDDIKTLLKEKDMEMVYVAYEYTDNRQKWESWMKVYDLKGYHVIANKKLLAELKQLADNQLSFPTFMIVDGEGKVLEPKAAYPSDGDKLYKQIDEMIY